MLTQAGIYEYSIFLDPETNSLFGFLKAEDTTQLDSLPAQAIMQKWWAYMSDIMVTYPDHSPISQPLKEVFYLP